MKVTNIEKSTSTIHRRVVTIEDGELLDAGPLYVDGIEFRADTVLISWVEGQSLNDVVVTGYRFRYGQLNKSYLHRKVYKSYSRYPEWLTEIIKDVAIDTLR